MSFAEVKPNPYLDKVYKGLDELAFGKDSMSSGLTSSPNMSYEECQASRDPRVLNMGDPCSGLPRSSFSDMQIESEVSPAVNPLSFLENFIQQSPDIAQLAPRMVRNVYTGYEGKPHVITHEDKLKMMMDYRDVLDHNSRTLRGVFGPLQAP